MNAEAMPSSNTTHTITTTHEKVISKTIEKNTMVDTSVEATTSPKLPPIQSEQIEMSESELIEKARKMMYPDKPYKIEDIRYQNIQYKKGAKKIQPNDPCPCGAKNENGKVKKYKKCHMWAVEN